MLFVSHPDPLYWNGTPISCVLWVLAANSLHLYSCLEASPWLLDAGSVGGYKSCPLRRYLGQWLTNGGG